MSITDLMQAEMGYLNSKFGSSVFFFVVCIAVYTRGCLVIYLLSITDWTSRLTLTAKGVHSSFSVRIESHSEFYGIKCEITQLLNARFVVHAGFE